MITTTYAHVVQADHQHQNRFPTRFSALDSLMRAATAVGTVVERAAIPMDSGLDAISVFSDTSDDQFLIMRINADTFTIRRIPRTAS